MFLDVKSSGARPFLICQAIVQRKPVGRPYGFQLEEFHELTFLIFERFRNLKLHFKYPAVTAEKPLRCQPQCKENHWRVAWLLGLACGILSQLVASCPPTALLNVPETAISGFFLRPPRSEQCIGRTARALQHSRDCNIGIFAASSAIRTMHWARCPASGDAHSAPDRLTCARRREVHRKDVNRKEPTVGRATVGKEVHRRDAHCRGMGGGAP